MIYFSMVLVSVALFAYGAKRNYKIATFMGLTIPIAFASIRSYVGTDFGKYVIMYNEIVDMSFSDFLKQFNVEPTFYWFTQISNNITGSPLLYFTIMSVATLIFFYLGLLKFLPNNIVLGYFVLLMLVFPLTLNIVRQGVAMAIVFYAFSFIIERNFKKYLFWMIIATLFHYSAILLLPIYFLNRFIKPELTNRTNQLRIIMLAICTAILIPVCLAIVPYVPIFNKYSTYIDIGSMGSNIQFYIKLVIIILISMLIRLSYKNKNYTLMLFYALSMLELALLFSGFFVGMTRRVSIYLIPYSVLLVPMIIQTIPPGYIKTIGKLTVVLYVVAAFLMLYYFAGFNQIFPYQTIFTRPYNEQI